MNVALQLDWQRQAVRRRPTPLPPLGVAVAGLPLVERLRFKSLDDKAGAELDLNTGSASLDQIDEDFWAAFDGLDRAALIQDTLAVLAAEGRPLSIAELARRLPPLHDLETFALWLAMARETGITVNEQQLETIELVDGEQRRWRFRLPYAGLDSAAVSSIDWEL